MIVIGKYFTTNREYVNVMKVSRKYQELVNKYEICPLIDYSLTKQKWEITIDVMMIIGKYLRTSKDYVNVMKTSKRYKELAQMYHFNPISECELFENMETQHLYTKEDKKKEEIHQYVFCYNPERKLEENETIKGPLKYVMNNMNILEEWSNKKFDSVLYDSDRDGKSSRIFWKRVYHTTIIYCNRFKR